MGEDKSSLVETDESSKLQLPGVGEGPSSGETHQSGEKRGPQNCVSYGDTMRKKEDGGSEIETGL